MSFWSSCSLRSVTIGIIIHVPDKETPVAIRDIHVLIINCGYTHIIYYICVYTYTYAYTYTHTYMYIPKHLSTTSSVCTMFLECTFSGLSICYCIPSCYDFSHWKLFSLTLHFLVACRSFFPPSWNDTLALSSAP